MPTLLSILGVAAVVFAIRFGLGPKKTWIERTIDALAVVSGCLLVIMFMARLTQLTSVDWVEGKLAPVVSMVHGYDLYQPADTGVMTGWIYGPVGALVMLPSAIAAAPTTARLIGNTIALTFMLGPGLWLLLCSGRNLSIRLAAGSVFGWMLIYPEDIARCSAMASADAPAIGLTAVACGLIWASPSRLFMLGSAVLLALAGWTKQGFALAPLGVAGYLLISTGPKASLGYLAASAAAAVSMGAVFAWWFGAANLYFHMIRLPMLQPWSTSLIHATAILGTVCTLGLAILGAAMLTDSAFRPLAKSPRQWIVSRKFSLLLFVAAAVVPGSLAGYMKVSGYVNNLGAVNYFIILAGLCGLVESLDEAPAQAASLVARSLMLLALILCAWTTMAESNGLVSDWPSLSHPFDNPEERVYRYALRHPGEVYCPWGPLTTFLADGRLYHFEWGLADRVNAHRPPTEIQYESHLPLKLNKVVYFSPPLGSLTFNTIVNFHRRVEDPDLPGLVVFMRDQ